MVRNMIVFIPASVLFINVNLNLDSSQDLSFIEYLQLHPGHLLLSVNLAKVVPEK